MNTSTDYNKTMHLVGRVTTLMALGALLVVPIAVCIIYGLEVDWGPTSAALMSVLMLMGPTSIVEFISYGPILGAGGMYLSFITGNIMNMKMPAAISSNSMMGYENGTPEAEAVSTIAVGISSLVTMAVLVVGLVLGTMLLPFLSSPTLAPAFANLMPAIMGALSIPRFAKDIKSSFGPCVVSALIYLVMGAGWYSKNNPYLIILLLLVAVAWSYILHSMEQKKKAG